MEQARRSALAHHVHRIAPMGARVLINGIRYYPAPNGIMPAVISETVSRSDRQIFALLHHPISRSATDFTLIRGKKARCFAAVHMSVRGTFRPIVRCARMSALGVGADMTQTSSWTANVGASTHEEIALS
jgi:hypothetical protein